MKALHCLACGDIVGPFHEAGIPRTCVCKRHLIWSVDAAGKQVAVFDWKGSQDSAFLLRISNDFLHYHAETDARTIQRLIDSRVGPSPFKQQRSPIVTSKIGALADSIWADSPPSAPVFSEAPVGRRTLLARLAAAVLGA